MGTYNALIQNLQRLNHPYHPPVTLPVFRKRGPGGSRFFRPVYFLLTAPEGLQALS